MDTQNTPLHIKIWHREFWFMAFANLFLMMSLYMLIPALPAHMTQEGFSLQQTAAVLGIYGIGVYALGGFCSYLVQKYRRNRVCLYAIGGVALSSAALYYTEIILGMSLEYWMLLIIRLVQGTLLGLAQMTLSSTLIIDTCESFQRTEANYTASWFSRVALAAGPFLSVWLSKWLEYGFILLTSCGMAVLALLLILSVKFPFKAPSDSLQRFSLDRFFLPQALPLFANLLIIMTIVGGILSGPHTLTFYAMWIIGYAYAILAEKIAFADAELKSEVITGLVLFGAALLIAKYHPSEYLVPAMFGFGTGIIGSRFLLFFIKLAKHCQRGTSQSTFFLAWESGIALGLFLGIQCAEYTLDGCLVLTGIALVLYNFFVHPWYLKNRNR